MGFYLNTLTMTVIWDNIKKGDLQQFMIIVHNNILNLSIGKFIISALQANDTSPHVFSAVDYDKLYPVYIESLLYFYYVGYI